MAKYFVMHISMRMLDFINGTNDDTDVHKQN